MNRISDRSGYTRDLSTLSRIQEDRDRNNRSLATGKKINSAADDAAGLAVAMKLETLVRESEKKISNAESEISLMQTADGALGQSSEVLQSIRESLVQAKNPVYTDTERAAIGQQIEGFRANLDEISRNTQFNTKNLLDGTQKLGGARGANIPDVSAQALGLENLDLTSPESIDSALTRVDQSIEQLSSVRGAVGARVNSLTSQIESEQNAQLSSVAGLSRILDQDMARAMVEKTSLDLKEQAALKVLQLRKREHLASLLE